MKKIIFFLNIILVFSNCANRYEQPKSLDDSWNKEKREQHLDNRNDSTTWNKDLLEDDIENMSDEDYGPFEMGVFPEPKYDLLGKDSFDGVGNKSGKYQMIDRSILMNSFFVSENALNRDRLKGMKNAIFFQILVLTDTIDNVNYNLANAVVVSRNHPDYLGQGFYKTKNNRIDYVAFTTAENETYAIINTRIFNLRFGKTILIAPQSDKTLRSLQIVSPEMSSDSIAKYTDQLIMEQKVISFFLNKDNI